MSVSPRLPHLVVSTSPAVVRQQESVIIGLNLAVLAAIACAHFLFEKLLGVPHPVFFVVILGRFLMQGAELAWVRAHTPNALHDRALLRYASASIWVNIAFAFALSVASGLEDSHYIALMVIPVIAAGFRYRPAGIATVVGVTGVLTVLEVGLYYESHQGRGPSEYFEAAGVALLYLIVALVVAFLAAQLRHEQENLNRSLEELRTAKDQLVREEKLAAVGRLASAVAHEVRNPVAMITSALALAHEPACEAGKRQELCTLAAEEARRLETLTGDFLKYARQREPRCESTEITTALGYVAGIAQGRVPQAGVTLSLECPADLTATVDAAQIHQALLNLVGNALDATPAGGRVVMGAGLAPDGTLELWVEDDGPAVPPADLHHLFEPFFTTKTHGTGLGLAISRNIAQAHGGELVLSRNEPGSVRFTLRLPQPAPDPLGDDHGPRSGG